MNQRLLVFTVLLSPWLASCAARAQNPTDQEKFYPVDFQCPSGGGALVLTKANAAGRYTRITVKDGYIYGATATPETGWRMEVLLEAKIADIETCTDKGANNCSRGSAKYTESEQRTMLRKGLAQMNEISEKVCSLSSNIAQYRDIVASFRRKVGAYRSFD